MVKKNTSLSNFVPVQDLAGNFVMPQPVKKKRGRPPKKPVEENITMVVDEIKKRGRPKKYNTPEEAKKAKIANTIKGAKKRKAVKKGGDLTDAQAQRYTDELELVYNQLTIAEDRFRASRKTQADIDIEVQAYNNLPLAEFITFYNSIRATDAFTQANIELIDELENAYNNYTDFIEGIINKENIPPPNPNIQGEGIFDDVKNLAKKATQAVVGAANTVKDTATSTFDKVKDTATALVVGRNDYPPKVRNILSSKGGSNITGIKLHRTPLGTPMMSALQIASGNTFSQKLSNTPYDNLFHLFACIDLDSSSKITLEKNEVINAENGCKIPKDTETKVISGNIPTGLTLNTAMEKTKERMGGKFFTYSAKDNNCQDFIVAFLQANNLGSQEDYTWVKQETKVLFEGNDRLRKIANTLTDIGARVDVLKQGVGTKKRKGKVGGGISTEEAFKLLTEIMAGAGGLLALNRLYRYAMERLRLNEAIPVPIAEFLYANDGRLPRADAEIPADVEMGRVVGTGGGASRPRTPQAQAVAESSALSASPVVAQNIAPYQDLIDENPQPVAPISAEIRASIEEAQSALARLISLGIITPASRAEIEAQIARLTNRLNNIEGRGLAKESVKKSNSNTLGSKGIKSQGKVKMANPWIEYVKAYAKKHNMKYNEALKDPKMKAGYKKGGGASHTMPDETIMTGKTHNSKSKKVGDGIMEDIERNNKITQGMFDNLRRGQEIERDNQKYERDAQDRINQRYNRYGRGIPTSKEDYIAQLYNQANLGANGKVRLN